MTDADAFSSYAALIPLIPLIPLSVREVQRLPCGVVWRALFGDREGV